MTIGIRGAVRALPDAVAVPLRRAALEIASGSGAHAAPLHAAYSAAYQRGDLHLMGALSDMSARAGVGNLSASEARSALRDAVGTIGRRYETDRITDLTLPVTVLRPLQRAVKAVANGSGGPVNHVRDAYRAASDLGNTRLMKILSEPAARVGGAGRLQADLDLRRAVAEIGDEYQVHALQRIQREAVTRSR